MEISTGMNTVINSNYLPFPFSFFFSSRKVSMMILDFAGALMSHNEVQSQQPLTSMTVCVYNSVMKCVFVGCSVHSQIAGRLIHAPCGCPGDEHKHTKPRGALVVG